MLGGLRALTVLAFVLIATPAPAVAEPARHVVVLDPGHGGTNTGAPGVVPGLYEKRLTLVLAREVKERLEKVNGVTVELTRDDDRFVSLRERVRRANRAGAELFVSIHCNASPTHAQRGFETWVLTPEALTVDAEAIRGGDGPVRPGVDPETSELVDDIERGAVQPQAVRLAERIQAHLAQVRGAAGNRGVQQGTQDVLMGPTMPAVLVEVGFIDHAAEGVEAPPPRGPRADRRRARRRDPRIAANAVRSAHASRQSPPRRAARDHHRNRRPETRRGERPHQGRRHLGPVRRLRRGKSPALRRARARLGHRRVRHAAALDAHAERPPSWRARPGDPAPHRSRAPCGRRSQGPRRAQALTLDCDVLAADGGTRTTAITGAWSPALSLALDKLRARGQLAAGAAVLGEPVAAVSVGIIDGEPRLDLCYAEDSRAPETDMNVVMTESGLVVEVQGTAERAPFPRATLDRLLDLAHGGIRELCQKQREALAAARA